MRSEHYWRRASFSRYLEAVRSPPDWKNQHVAVQSEPGAQTALFSGSESDSASESGSFCFSDECEPMCEPPLQAEESLYAAAGDDPQDDCGDDNDHFGDPRDADWSDIEMNTDTASSTSQSLSPSPEEDYTIFTLTNKDGPTITSWHTTHFKHLIAHEIRHEHSPTSEIIARAHGTLAEVFERNSVVAARIEELGYTVVPLSRTPLSMTQKVAGRLYALLAGDEEVMCPLNNTLILGTRDKVLLIIHLGPDMPIWRPGHTYTTNGVAYPILGAIEDGEPRFQGDVRKYLSLSKGGGVPYRFSDRVREHEIEAMEQAKAEAKRMKRRSQRQKVAK